MIKRSIMAFGLIASTLGAPAFAQVGVSVSVGQPGFYGRIDIGDYPRPALIYRQPMVINPVPPGMAPVYLRVPPGHAKNWRKHCHRYDACGVPAYFVTDSWYQREYVPRYEHRHGGRGYDGGYREYRGGDRDGHRGGDWDNDRRGDRGPGHGRGNGHGNGNGRGNGPGRD